MSWILFRLLVRSPRNRIRWAQVRFCNFPEPQNHELPFRVLRRNTSALLYQTAFCPPAVTAPLWTWHARAGAQLLEVLCNAATISFYLNGSFVPGAKGGSVLITRKRGDYKWLTRAVWDRARLSPSLPRVARWPTVLPALLTAGRFHDAPRTPGWDVVKGMLVCVHSLVSPSISSELSFFFFLLDII